MRDQYSGRSGGIGTIRWRVPNAVLRYDPATVRIAIVTDFYYPALGGITEHVDGQARELTALGHEVTVVTGNLLQEPSVQDDAMRVPEPTFEIVRIGTAVRLYVPGGATAPRRCTRSGPGWAGGWGRSSASAALTSSTSTRRTTPRCRRGRSTTPPTTPSPW